MANTALSPSMVHSAANQHREYMQLINQQRSNLAGQISAVEAQSSSKMTQQLNIMFQQWSDDLENILKDLDAMAADMDKFANWLVQHDDDNSSSVRGVMSIPAGSFGSYLG